MAIEIEQQEAAACEYVRVQNYQNMELMITKARWFVIGFLSLYLNILRLTDWPLGLFNALLAFAALYNLWIHLYLKKTHFFSTRLTLVFLYLDMLVIAVGLNYTGGLRSPFLFIWYLTLFATGIRLGFRQSFLLQVPMAVFYAYLMFRDMASFDADHVNRLILGLASLVATSLYGSLFSRGEQYTMKVLADYRRASITDKLTGLFNYAHFMDRLKHEQYRADRDHSHFSVIIFDLDRFKQVNDTYGHEKGNILLKAIAEILTMNARRMDTVARYGGEEFVILMPESRGAEREMAERIRKKVEATEFAGIAEVPIRVTVSGGLCTYPDDAGSLDDILARADKALYAAKTEGRNRTRTYAQLTSSPN
ncbi:MAG TPA: GGDEF domain-containing protein [Nitrospirota bacterium]|nr:GGDEF domain-containing protein [Nitrospirota bacterium]